MGETNSGRLKLLKRIGESGFWRRVGKVHTALFRATRGRIGGSLTGLDHLLLTTIGRKSGQERTCPLTYLADGDRYVLVASNGGSDRPPAWYFNLVADPQVTLEVGGDALSATARIAEGEERDALWGRLKAYNPFYADYEQVTDRTIPVVVCTPDRHS